MQKGLRATSDNTTTTKGNVCEKLMNPENVADYTLNESHLLRRQKKSTLPHVCPSAWYQGQL